jgi:hypothetical protein
MSGEVREVQRDDSSVRGRSRMSRTEKLLVFGILMDNNLVITEHMVKRFLFYSSQWMAPIQEKDLK